MYLLTFQILLNLYKSKVLYLWMVLFQNKLIDANNVIELDMWNIGILIFTCVNIMESEITIQIDVLETRLLQESG